MSSVFRHMEITKEDVIWACVFSSYIEKHMSSWGSKLALCNPNSHRVAAVKADAAVKAYRAYLEEKTPKE